MPLVHRDDMPVVLEKQFDVSGKGAIGRNNGIALLAHGAKLGPTCSVIDADLHRRVELLPLVDPLADKGGGNHDQRVRGVRSIRALCPDVRKRLDGLPDGHLVPKDRAHTDL